MIDLLFLAHNRLEFTKASLATLILNTNWSRVSRFIIYDDASEGETADYLYYFAHPKGGESFNGQTKPELRRGEFGSPVSVMNHYLCGRSPTESHLFAKIDSDTMLPAGWLDDCLHVMEARPTLDLLGIEAFHPSMPAPLKTRSTEPAQYIGGIGLMRASAFVTLPRPNGRFGFTAWQDQSPNVTKGWLVPALPVFLLDRLPREPWQSLSREYIDRGWQRPWAPYEEKDRDLWAWWCE